MMFQAQFIAEAPDVMRLAKNCAVPEEALMVKFAINEHRVLVFQIQFVETTAQ